MLEEYKNDISGDRKRLRRTSKNDMMNERCLNWFHDATNRCMPVSVPVTQQQALEFPKDLNNYNFKASNRWLDSLL